MSNIPMELNALATEFFAGLQLQSLATLLDGIDSILGITIPIPDIPGIGVSFVDLLTANANDLIAALKAQYAIAGDFSFLGFLQPFVSDPLFQGLGIPDYEFGVALQNIIRGYTSTIYMLIFGGASAISDAVAALVGGGAVGGDYMLAFTLLSLPTTADLLALLPATPSLADLKALAIAGIPGFPGVNISDLPDPLFAGFEIPELELQEGIKSLQTKCSQYSTDMMMGWINSLPFMDSLPWPNICLPDVGVIAA